MLKKAFIILPIFSIVELILLIVCGRYLGVLATLLLLFLAAFLGLWVMKREGLAVLRHLRESFDRRQMPGESLLDAACLLFGGFLLVVPGFLSDIAGLLFLIPKTRTWIKRYLKYKLAVIFSRRSFSFYAFRKKY